MKILNAIFLTVLSSVISAHAHRVQRFIILNRSELKVVPKFEFPVQMRSLRSTFNLQIPIQLRITNHMQLRVRNQLRQFRNSNRSHFEWNHFARSVSDQARANFHDNLLESTSLNWFSGLLFKANSSMKNDAVSFKECVQKMVCQVSTIPAMHPDYGLIGDILYTLFRSTEATPLSSENHGKWHGSASAHESCALKFNKCPIEIFDLVKLL